MAALHRHMMRPRQTVGDALTRRTVLRWGVAGLAFGASARSGVADSSMQARSLPLSADLSPPDWSTLEAGPLVLIDEVVDGDTVELERGPDVRLVGTQAPKLPLGRDHVEEWPLADVAKRHLEDLIEGGGRQAQLFFGGRKRDRHGRHLAHVRLQDGTWLQGAMMLAGLARVYTFADNRALIPQLLLREAIARAERRQIWQNAFYAIRDARDPSALLRRLNRFELVEGVVRNVADHRERWYLNFGETWREDFTVTIDRDHDPVFENSTVRLHDLEGTAIRVRGWIMEEGGPLIRIDHPEAIEPLSRASR